VILEPGFSCVLYSESPTDKEFFRWGSSLQVDNEGNLLIVRRLKYFGNCGGWRTQLVSFDGSTEKVIAHIDDRCGSLNTEDRVEPRLTCAIEDASEDCRLTFDGGRGRVLIPLRDYCRSTSYPYSCSYESKSWIAAIQGFATTFEILQTYEPSTGEISFRVPYMPEGFEGADWFDTYWGDLTTVGDWGSAKGLRCHYPDAPPSVGDFFTVADTLPDRGHLSKANALRAQERGWRPQRPGPGATACLHARCGGPDARVPAMRRP
jgi:hypothetical protein